MDYSYRLGQRTELLNSSASISMQRRFSDTQEELLKRYSRQYEINAPETVLFSEPSSPPFVVHPRGNSQAESQNKQLREELAKAYVIIDQLRAELAKTEAKTSQSRRQSLMTQRIQISKISQLTQEIKAIITQNQLLSKEIQALKVAVSTKLSLGEAKIPVPRLTPECLNTLGIPLDCLPQFLNCLQDMQFKMEGRRAESLRELWRWIKTLGHQSRRRYKNESQLCEGRGNSLRV